MKSLCLCYSGTEYCVPNHQYGPAVRDCYLVHYIYSGRGIFDINGERYQLSKGQAFLITPGVLSYYQADAHDPWQYVWVGFDGSESKQYLSEAGFSQESPVYTPNADAHLLPHTITNTLIDSGSSDLARLANLYLFFDFLIRNTQVSKKESAKSDMADFYIKRSIQHIHSNYWNKITVVELSELCNIHRSYLSRAFQNKLKQSPQQFILEYKMKKACEFLSDRNLTISEVAHSVGYVDLFTFSKAFKKIYGVSPSVWRANI